MSLTEILNESFHEIDAIVEISQNSLPVKYEFDKQKSLFRVDRFLPTSMNYPTNYGFIPDTQSGDGDPIDVLILTRFPVITGATIRVKVIGALSTTDESGEDIKVLSVPVDKVDMCYSEINDYFDLPKIILDSIEHFFASYKALEKNKYVTVNGWKGSSEARAIIYNSFIKN